MKSIYNRCISKWNNYFFNNTRAESLALVRIILFGFTTYIFWNNRSPHYPNGLFFEDWTPFFFYKLFPRPLTREELDYVFFGFRLFGILATIGLFTKVSSFLAVLFSIIRLSYYFNFSSQVYHHSHMIMMSLILISLVPSGKALSIDWLINKVLKRSSNQIIIHGDWVIQGIRVWVALVFFSSGLQKWFYGQGLEWALSSNLAIRMLENAHMSAQSISFIQNYPWAIQIIAFFTLLVELVAPIALINRKCYFAMGLSWILFHFGVKTIFGGHSRFLSQAIVILAPLIYWQTNRFLESRKLRKTVSNDGTSYT